LNCKQSKNGSSNLRTQKDAIREKSRDPLKWNASELHTMVSWFKQPGDSNIPKRKEHHLQRYLLTCHCSELELKRKKDYEPIIMSLHQPMMAKSKIMRKLRLLVKKMLWMCYKTW
jgi:hypothetical protein